MKKRKISPIIMRLGIEIEINPQLKNLAGEFKEPASRITFLSLLIGFMQNLVVPLSSQWVVMESPDHLRRVGVKYLKIRMREVALIGDPPTPSERISHFKSSSLVPSLMRTCGSTEKNVR